MTDLRRMAREARAMAEDAQDQLRSLERRAGGAASAQVLINDRGATTVAVGLLAVVCLVVAVAVAWVGWQQTQLTQQQAQELRSRVEMLEARLVMAESRIQRLKQ